MQFNEELMKRNQTEIQGDVMIDRMSWLTQSKAALKSKRTSYRKFTKPAEIPLLCIVMQLDKMKHLRRWSGARPLWWIILWNAYHHAHWALACRRLTLQCRRLNIPFYTQTRLLSVHCTPTVLVIQCRLFILFGLVERTSEDWGRLN